ncbi:MAG TPA: polysaccharide deacetylase family protein [Blastocatellia bacterium]|nr:polysaccharide deacetylase family protein [Blastocatellia bacterium]
MNLDRGVFTISIDLELIWGTIDLVGSEPFSRACKFEREIVIDRLLDLFAEYEISATWCVLGHLMLDHCQSDQGRKHPEIVRPQHTWHEEDWFVNDPARNEDAFPLFYGRTLVDKIRRCSTPQEIGCHSFSHVIFGDPGCSHETAESEINASVLAARQLGIEMRSFAFPRNEVGHLDLLKKYGFTSYRGPEKNWYGHQRWPTPVKRLCHLWDVIAAATPDVPLPERDEIGIWNLRGSMIYFPAYGLRRYIPISRRVKRAIKGLNAAAERRRVFHLWFHPTNLADEPDAMFSGLRRILDHASSLRERGNLAIKPMSALIPATGSETSGSEDFYTIGAGTLASKTI